MSLTPEQQAIRRTRVTASTLPAFLGYSPYQSPQQEWERHLGRVPNGDNNDTQSGQEFEEAIARSTARVLGISFERFIPGATLVHPGANFLVATPDYLVAGVDPYPACGVQCKKHAPHMLRTYPERPGARGEWDNGLVPIQYELQCQIEMLVVGAVEGGQAPLFWYLSAYFGGHSPRVYKLRRDERLQDSLLKIGETFWRECIDPDGPQCRPDPARWPWRMRLQNQPQPKPPPKLGRDALLSAPLPELPMAECELPAPNFGET